MDLAEVVPANVNRHPWELSRRDSLIRLLSDFGPFGDVADVGAGDRFFTTQLRALATGRVYAIDNSYPDGGVTEGIQLGQTAADLPDAALDAIVMMDVLEHVEEESALLGDVRRALRPGGIVLVTVPAFQSLFGAHDAFLKHVRRYNMRQLRSALEANGFKVEKAFYFYFALCMARVLQLAWERIAGPPREQGAGFWRLGARHPVTVGIKTFLDLDYRGSVALAKMGLIVPGLSLCAVCRKTSA